MRIRKFGQACLSAAIFFGMVFQGAPLSGIAQAESNLPMGHGMQQTDFPPEQIITTEDSLDKLSPDLRARVQETVVENGLASAQERDLPLLVSAQVQPGADVERFFTRSIRSREIAGMQWVTGELSAKALRKLAGVEEVLGVFSLDTYQTTEAPGLDELRTNPPALSGKEIRAMLSEGGPDLLMQSIRRNGAPALKREPVQWPQPDPAAGTFQGTIPGVRSIHEVDQVLAQNIDGAGVVVGIVDSGVDFGNPDLQGVQALISGGVYAGWPFAYDTISGAMYAIDQSNTLGPDNFWDLVGWTQYVHTLPVKDPVCGVSTCTAALDFIVDNISISLTWPKTSKSGKYYYSIHPDLSLAFMASNRQISYPEGLLPSPIIVSDEHQPGVYDTVYTDINYDKDLTDASERVTREQPLSGTDLNGDGVWDMSGGMLAWISDGVHHPPAVEMLYPEVAELEPPEAGLLVAFITDQEGHGTSCASQVAGQGRITDPNGIGPANPLYNGGAAVGGRGGAVVASMAPGVKIAAFQNGYSLPLDAWAVAVLGMDGQAGSGDEVNILSNSWGDSFTIEDGWDLVSRFAQQISYETAPEISFLVSTGNGGHGYGTVTSPGGGPIIDVGASTAYGAVNGFEYVGPEQFLYGDIQPWSNRGPGALGDIAPDIVAVGAWGTGAVPLNTNYSDGQSAYDVFGGTSMSAPIAAGNLALVYQAYEATNGEWPTWQAARDLLLNGAQDLGYDVFTQGNGNIRADRSVQMAQGTAPWVSPVQWYPGDYRGINYQAFPAIMHPGDQSTQQFTVRNPGSTPLALTAQAVSLQQIYQESFSYAFTNPAPESPHELPIYLEELTSLIDQYQPDLVRAQVIMPFTKFDLEGDAYADSWWGVSFYDWLDRNENGLLWADANDDGRVNEEEIEIDDTSGLFEFNRFTYGWPQGNVLEASLGAESLLHRHDGVYLGLRCYFCGQSTTLQVLITFYQKADWPWVALSPSTKTIPAEEQDSFQASLTVPASTSPGAYEGEIVLKMNEAERIIPIVAHVAADSTTFQFGGPSDLSTPYSNSNLIGGFNWNWRYDAGDWRFYYFDVPDGSAGVGKSLLVNTGWSSPYTDVDTWVLGADTTATAAIRPQSFGPQEMKVSAGSVDAFLNSGRFAWYTNTGAASELVRAPLQNGLGEIILHNVLNGGLQLAENFEGSVFQVAVDPGEIELQATVKANAVPLMRASQEVTFTSTGDIEDGIQILTFGMTLPVALTGQPITQNNPTDICSSSWVYRRAEGGLEVSNGGLLEIATSSADELLDLDLYLYQDDGDEKWVCGKDRLKTYSNGASAEENVKIIFPEDGIYWAVVHGNQVPNESAKFDMSIHSIGGGDLTVENLPMGSVRANEPRQFKINYSGLYESTNPTAMEGLLLIGTPAVPALVEVPVSVRPAILLYPQPQLYFSSRWAAAAPVTFRLEFQNLGMQPETATAEITVPNGLVYLPGSASGPGAPVIYDASARTLTWTGSVGDGEKVSLAFQAAGQPGFPPGKVIIPFTVEGAVSGQKWLGELAEWVNLYGLIFPRILRP